MLGRRPPSVPCIASFAAMLSRLARGGNASVPSTLNRRAALYPAWLPSTLGLRVLPVSRAWLAAPLCSILPRRLRLRGAPGSILPRRVRLRPEAIPSISIASCPSMLFWRPPRMPSRPSTLFLLRRGIPPLSEMLLLFVN
eukprot:1585065-Rhodomonas_salina.1